MIKNKLIGSTSKKGKDMRKTKLIAGALILGVAFMSAPAFADYNETSTFLSQADNTANAPDFGAIGALADENATFGAGTIQIPAHVYDVPWDTPGCNPNVTMTGGGAIPGEYNCTPGSSGNAFEPTVNIQDVFQAVLEGNVDKVAGAQGIHQYLDSLFSMPGENGSDGLGTNANLLYIDQTLDQDLADLTSGPGLDKGIWQRLHSTVDILGSGNDTSTTGLYPGQTQAIGMDQTVEAFVSDFTPAGTYSAHTLLTSEHDANVVVYLGQWFQGGENLKCGDGVPTALCTHNEFGGHGTITANKFTPNVTQHDP